MYCNKGHRHNPSFNLLPENQGGFGRHKCTGCAFEKGFIDGFNNNKPYLDENTLPFSQAGTGRHKDVQTAYINGYQLGQNSR